MAHLVDTIPFTTWGKPGSGTGALRRFICRRVLNLPGPVPSAHRHDLTCLLKIWVCSAFGETHVHVKKLVAEEPGKAFSSVDRRCLGFKSALHSGLPR